MHQPVVWAKEFFFVAALLGLLAVFGQVLGMPLLLPCLGLAGWFGWHLYNLRRLIVWLRDGKSGNKLPKDIPGLWGHVYYGLQARSRKDKSRKKRIRKMLKEFSRSAQALPDATVVLNEALEIQWMNGAARELLRLQRGDLGQLISDLIRVPEFSRWLEATTLDRPLIIASPLDPDVSLLLRLVAYGQGQYLLLARDITERRQLDRMRQDFVANASHELRTPLTVLQGSLEEISLRLQDKPELERPIEWMQRQTGRMQNILSDLLVLARLENQEGQEKDRKLIDIGNILENVLDDARSLSEKLGGHDISVNIDPALNMVGSRDAIQSVMTNLITNAVRYTPAGGNIHVLWEKKEDGGYFAVTDSGPGIPAQHIPRLTERFYRVDVGRSRDSGGTGLGLAIAKHILERYNSGLEITSAPGRGSTFGFTIPREFLKKEK